MRKASSTMGMLSTFNAYYKLTKPGIIQGNALHVIAGALLASTMGLDVKPLAGVLIGTSFVIASACVANNYMDRGIDAKMKRTKQRASVTGLISLRNAMIYAFILLIIGFYVLYAFTNPLVIVIGIVAYCTYVFAYGWAKRHTIHSTLVGAIPGALPAMAGYVAITNSLSVQAWLVFLLVFVWQMPHFYAISLFRRKEYSAAGIPVMGVVRHFDVVRRYILAYMVAYLGVICLMISTKVVGVASALLLIIGAAYWLFVFVRTDTSNKDAWARSIFGASLLLTLVLLVVSIMNTLVPPLQ